MQEDILQFQVNEEGNIAVVEFRGELELDSGRALKEQVEALGDQFSTVILDLRLAICINSSGIGQLVSILRACTLRERKLKLVNLSPAAMQVMTLTKLNRVLSIYDSLDAARSDS